MLLVQLDFSYSVLYWKWIWDKKKAASTQRTRFVVPCVEAVSISFKYWRAKFLHTLLTQSPQSPEDLFTLNTKNATSLFDGPEKTLYDGYGYSSPRYSVRTTMPSLVIH